MLMCGIIIKGDINCKLNDKCYYCYLKWRAAMVKTKGQNASTLTPFGRLYKKERMVKKKCLFSID